MTKALDGALAAAKRGLRVIPLSPLIDKRKENPSWLKIPRIQDWPNLATTDEETIRRWAEGDFTGTSSKSSKPCDHFGAGLDGFFVFDADSREAQEEIKSIFNNCGCPRITATYCVRTGRGGYHYIYRQPKGFNLGNSANKLAPKLDTRGGVAGYIVLPGTTNPATRGEYIVASNREIAELPITVAEYVLDKLGEAKDPRRGEIKRREGSEPDTDLKIRTATEFLESHPGGVEGDGGEEDAVFVGRVLADIGLSYEKAVELATELYSPKCAPSWDDCLDELERKIRNGFIYRDEPVGVNDPDLLLDMFPKVFDDDDEYGPLTEADLTKFKVVNMREFRKMPPPKRLALWDGFMAHGKHLTLIVGRGGEGKSLLTMQMLRELIRGRTFLGLKPGEGTANLKAVLFSLEEPSEDVHWRYYKMSNAVDPFDEHAEPDWVDMRGVVSDIFKIEKGVVMQGAGFRSFVRTIKENGFKLVALDGLSRLFFGNENDRAMVSSFGTVFDKLTQDTGAHFIMLAHTNRGGDFSGSSAWEAICRQMYTISSETFGAEAYGLETVYKMTATKTNEGRRGVFVRYKWTEDWYFVPVSEEEYKKISTADGVREYDVSGAESIIRELLGEPGEMTYGELQKLMRLEGVDKGTLDVTLSTLENEGTLRREKRRETGGTYSKTFVVLS